MQKSTTIAIFIAGTLFLYFWYIVAYSFYDIDIARQNEFTTDGCTLFVSGIWAQCCVEHDKEYWQGGSSKKRRDVDRVFRDCVFDITKSKSLSFAMYSAVRVGGGPFISVPWRWGYGWEFGRGYR